MGTDIIIPVLLTDGDGVVTGIPGITGTAIIADIITGIGTAIMMDIMPAIITITTTVTTLFTTGIAIV